LTLNESDEILIKKLNPYQENKLNIYKKIKNKQKSIDKMVVNKVLKKNELVVEPRLCKKCNSELKKVPASRSICTNCEIKNPRNICIYCNKEISVKTLQYTHECEEKSLILG